MAHEDVVKVVERATTDPAFRAHLQRQPEAALAGYDLTVEERGAIMSADPNQLSAIGVDSRMTKSFTFMKI